MTRVSDFFRWWQALDQCLPDGWCLRAGINGDDGHWFYTCCAKPQLTRPIATCAGSPVEAANKAVWASQQEETWWEALSRLFPDGWCISRYITSQNDVLYGFADFRYYPAQTTSGRTPAEAIIGAIDARIDELKQEKECREAREIARKIARWL